MHNTISLSLQIRYLENRDNEALDVVCIDWNKSNVVRLLIHFHVASSQFPLRRDLVSPDAIFVLRVNVSSKIIDNWVYDYACQVR